jgi:hypothetical protein
MCKKILYLCACGHYARQSARALCSELCDGADATFSPPGPEANPEFGLRTNIQNAQDIVSPTRTSWDVDSCRALRCMYRKRDPYWRKRWCEECRGRGIRARERLIKDFGFSEEQRPVSQAGVVRTSSESAAPRQQLELFDEESAGQPEN